MIFEKKGNAMNMICSTNYFLHGTKTSRRKPQSHLCTEKWSLGLLEWLECEVRNPRRKKAMKGKPPYPHPMHFAGTGEMSKLP